MLERKTITLYLAGWQKRMIMDYMKLDVPIEKLTRVTVKVLDKRHLVTYRVPIFEDVKLGAWNLYLTDEQINKLTTVLGLKTKITALNVTPEMVKSEAVVFA